MTDELEIDLMPISIKNQMRAIRIVSVWAVGCTFTLLIAMFLFGIIQDVVTALVFSFILLFVTTPLLIPGFRYDKISQSKICFTSDRICILDKKGECWRSIDYSIISDIQIKDVTGFFYGENKNMYKSTYICIFLNGITDVPPVPFAKLFTENDFIMFGYQAEALQLVLRKYRD